MIKESIGVGETLEIAKDAACRELGVETHEVEFEILQTPTKGALGIFGKKEAKVRAFIRISPLMKALNYLKAIIDAMNLHDVEISSKEEEGAGEIFLSGEEAWALVGRRGETINALQYLVGLVANNSVDEDYYRISINVENYREKREKILKNLAAKTARYVLKTKRKYILEPMNPYERKLFHEEIQNINGVVSWSEGEGIKRHIVVGIESKGIPKLK